MNETNELLPIFSTRFGKHLNFSNEDYLHAFGRESDALLYSVLFFPALIEIEHSIFLKRNVIDLIELKNKLITTKDKKQLIELESNFNFVEVGYLFGPAGRDISDEEDRILAYRIRDAWEGWLKVRYPERKFIVGILTPEETGSTIGVHFYEDRT